MKSKQRIKPVIREIEISGEMVSQIECPECNTFKEYEAFPPDNRRPTGRSSKCRDCTNAYLRERQASKPKQRDTYNKIIADHGDWVEVDISTKKFPDMVMRIDKPDWEMIRNDPKYGKVFVHKCHEGRYLYAETNMKLDNGKYRKIPIHKILNPDWNMIDHINLVGIKTGLDNRRSNLRETSFIENAYNGHSHNDMNNQTEYINMNEIWTDPDYVIALLEHIRPANTGWKSHIKNLISGKKLKGSKDDIRHLLFELKDRNMLHKRDIR